MPEGATAACRPLVLVQYLRYRARVQADGVSVLAFEAAAEVEALIAGAPDALMDGLERSPSAYVLHRHRHRDEHLDRVERTLAAVRAAAPPADRS